MDLQINKFCDWYSFLGAPLANKKKPTKFVNVSPIKLMGCRFISESNLLPAKERGNLRELLPTFVNPSQRFQESPRCFGIIRFKALKWPPKINRKF